ncbi:amylo-alpha-1,6-glucosidase [Spirosoma sp. HMF4905]|uniref:Amylo-alpha-1,6-glucosidase n=1 Tax=Spirosoma arboris TaxID=2682092 RepID=A0A7K1SIR3_9BACT|nr:GH116 family glycosyl hydrolase [Spirosoma arboris]MVM33456.1 amylo-alpha-1,6-glucosidase [Spirosoma arboris]
MRKFSCAVSLLVSIIEVLTAGNSFGQSNDLYSAELMNGLSNKGANLTKPYITAGDRTYIVGTQNGDFPDLGSHVKGEMGGLWMAPIKLLDGFWLKLTNEKGGASAWLKDAREFITYPYGSKFLYSPILDGIQVERFQYCPQGKEGIVVTYTIKNSTSKSRVLTVDFVAKTDVSPVWFSKENNIIDATDSISWNANRSVYLARDVKNSWFTVWGSSIPASSHALNVPTPTETIGLGKSASSTHRVTIKPNEQITAVFVIAGSTKNSESALASYEAILKNQDRLLAEKKAYYASIINRVKLDIPDKKLQQVVNWGKVDTEWLVSDLPGIGRFLGAGAIEYPWLFGCDNSYAQQGVVALGGHELAKSTLRTIKQVSEKTNGNGRIIHEMSSNGFVGNKGNTQETAQFAIAVWKVFEWTGDVDFLKEMYPYIKQGIHWLLTDQDKNGNMFPEGYGIMEVKGLNAELVDVAVYTQQALDVTSKMAAIVNDPAAQQDYAQKATVLKNLVNTLFWDETEGSYCDFYGTREQAITTTKGAIEQLQLETRADNRSHEFVQKEEFYKKLLAHLETFPEGTQKGWFTNKNWVISTPIESGIAPSDKAIKLLDKVRTEHTGAYGPYLSAVERRSMMTIATGVQAVAEATYGRTDESMWYVNKLVQTFGRVLPGSISEMMPDYGCPDQAWTIYGLAVPLITHVFGVQPDAYKKTITFSPNLPSGWDNINVSDLPVGNNLIAFAVKKTSRGTEYDLSSKNADWNYTIKQKGLRGKKYVLNGKTLTANSDELHVGGKSAIILLLN